MKTRVAMSLLILALALPLLSVAQEPAAAQPGVVLRVTPLAAVVTPTEPIQLSAALANTLDEGVKAEMPAGSVVRWKLTDPAGAVLAEKTTEIPPVSVSLPKGSIGAVGLHRQQGVVFACPSLA